MAATPDLASKLVAAGHEVAVQCDAGVRAGFLDEAYATVGASLLESASEVAEISDIVLHVGKP